MLRIIEPLTGPLSKRMTGVSYYSLSNSFVQAVSRSMTKKNTA
jgi:hypothetical protein